MIRSYRILAIVFAAMLASPMALATWSSVGQVEPSTAADRNDGFMFGEAPAAHEKKNVYFNAFFRSVDPGLGSIGVNPNVGALDTHIDATGNRMALALLGVWVDCNQDGYIGMAETAVQEYRSELLLDSSLCPPMGGTGSEKLTHNDGTWVTELLFIGNPRQAIPDAEPACVAGTDGRVIRDCGSRVWGDSGLPGDDGETRGGATCPISPFPRGTMQSTGGLLQYGDCQLGLGDNWNELVLTADPSNSQGLALDDENEWRQDGHVTNHETFGDEDSSNSMATVFDCNNAVVDETGPGDNRVRVYMPAPQLTNPDGSIAGTVNWTMESAPVEAGRNSPDCNADNDRGGDLYETLLNEGDHEGQTPADKRQAQWDFNFVPMARGGAPGIALGATKPQQAAQNLGISAVQIFGTIWTCNCVTTGTLTPVPARTNLVVDPDAPSADPQAGAAPRYFTFYAHIDPSVIATSALVVPNPGATYGAAWCQGATSGVIKGFNCDANLWNMNGDGSAPKDRALKAFPGLVYQLRDIDCYDSSVAGTLATCV